MVPCQEVVYLVLCSRITCRAFVLTLHQGGKNDSLT